jgi:hypothetical protein
MSISNINKELNYSLYNKENYKKELDIEIHEIIKKYSKLIIDYFKFIIENIKIKNKVFARYIITRGLDTVSNVFFYLLFYTKNIDITYFHCQKSFYFYIEFVGQISEDEKIFLELTSRDATIYVYKKTIFEITPELKKTNEYNSETTKTKIKNIHLYVWIYRRCMEKLITSDDFNTNQELLLQFETLTHKMNNLIISDEDIPILEKIVEKLYYNIENSKLFFDINISLIKKIAKNQDIIKKCEKNIHSIVFLSRIHDTNEKFLRWIIS